MGWGGGGGGGGAGRHLVLFQKQTSSLHIDKHQKS